MRWPWQRVAADDDDRARGAGVAPGETGAGPASVTPPAQSPAGWAFLPPLQREIGLAPPATLRSGWIEALPTRAVPTRVAELTHVVDSAAPAGTVAAAQAEFGAPVQRAVAADLTLRPPRTAAELAREKPTAVQRQAATTVASGSGSDSGERMPVAGDSPNADAAGADASIAESSVVEASVVETPVIETPATDGSHPSGSVAAANDVGARPAERVSLDLPPSAVQRTVEAGRPLDGPEPEAPVDSGPAHDASSSAGQPAEPSVVEPIPAETPTIAASRTERDVGRFGLAAPLPGVRTPASPSEPSVQRSTAPGDVRGDPVAPVSPPRRMGLGAPLPHGGVPAVRPVQRSSGEAGQEPVVETGRAEVGSEVQPPTPTPTPTALPLQREAVATPHPAASPGIVEGPSGDEVPRAAGAADRSGPSTADPTAPALERPAGLDSAEAGDPGDERSAFGGSPVEWAAPVELPLQRMPADPANPPVVGGAASAEAAGAASIDPESSASALPAADAAASEPGPPPAPEEVPLIAQRALDSSFEALASTAMPLPPRAVPATAVVVEPAPPSKPAPAAPTADRPASVQRTLASGPTADSASLASAGLPDRRGSSGSAEVASDRGPAPRNAILGWVQRTFAPSPSPSPSRLPSAAPSSDARQLRDDLDDAAALGASTSASDAGSWNGQGGLDSASAGQPDFGGLGSIGRAPAVAQSASVLPTAPSSGRVSNSGTLPIGVQRAVPTIPGPPAASVSRMALPVATPAATRREADPAGDDGAIVWTMPGIAAGSDGSPEGPVVQTEAESGETPPTPPTAPATPAVAPAAGAAGASAGAVDTSPAGIETLAARLYGPLARRLKAELLLDRERRGIRIDGI
ncbi:hypothetical protein SAMN05428970_0644 [Agromyces sp. CF514]|uniref:hypothetical protein n=1 Tax=Agromyces sp. CF514 TaxID=1881031 RepID=UPI0008E212BD|nr:hypothetical protein [Agromyces sp. CF514]SFR69256.1 hypothetical protein SAMN05428970_0644 [Agromyces sp. CF514]